MIGRVGIVYYILCTAHTYPRYASHSRQKQKQQEIRDPSLPLISDSAVNSETQVHFLPSLASPQEHLHPSDHDRMRLPIRPQLLQLLHLNRSVLGEFVDFLTEEVRIVGDFCYKKSQQDLAWPNISSEI